MSEQQRVDEEFDDIIQQVDQPSYDAPVKLRSRVLTEQRLPVLPAWAKDADEFHLAARWVAAHYWHVAKYHTARIPLYAGRLAARLPLGIWRAAALTIAWTRDSEAARRLSLMHEDPDNHEYVRLKEMHANSVQTRTGAVLIAVAAAVGLATLMWPTLELPWRIITAVLPVAGLSKLGERRDQPIVSRAVIATKAERLTAETVEQALWQLRNMSEKTPVRFPAPITRDGSGWRADVDLPPGITAAEVIEQRDKLAAALRRPQGAVWPEPAPDVHPGRLVLWVGDQDMADAKPAQWPLAKKGTVNLFDPIPFGVDQRGRPVTITLMFASMVVGAVSRMGKTFAVRLLALAGMLDVRCEGHFYDLKGTGDFAALEPVAHRYRAGDDPDDIAYALADMRELQKELRRRAKVIRGLPPHVCPENKVTDDLANRKQLRLHPILLVIDECQLWYQHPDHGEEFEAVVSDLSKRGPAVGIVVIDATQEPNSKTLPTAISRNAVLRFCLKVMDQVANDAVLGTSAYKIGVRATLFKRSDVGIGLLVGEGDEPRVVRAYFVDNPSAVAIVERARALREKAGTLTGDAAGDTIGDTGDTARLLVDILAVVPAGEEKVWSSDLCDRLAEHSPALYEGWDPTTLATALKPHGVDTQVLRIGERTQRGVRRERVVDALERGR